ncbi:recombinase family protein [Aneurinibacillus uraniidurans]|uniref:recombinase family protein n=1 Tax=Aneurinibacillus uraniidurans TaxID=2966586 RepID=UPI0023497DEA|nr:recombinase family protein [Aneurinibacillus sp. B1]WCN38660.1 recombinase family protein [Aneurinibacillus sp. B1]
MLTVAYYRRSSTIQEHSIEMQRFKALQCSIKHSLIIDQEFIDDAVSARQTNIQERKALHQILDLVDQGKVKNLIVYKRDRLARNTLQHLLIYHKLRAQKVNVIFTAEQELSMEYTPIAEFFELILGSMLQREGEQIIHRAHCTNNLSCPKRYQRFVLFSIIVRWTNS